MMAASVKLQKKTCHSTVYFHQLQTDRCKEIGSKAANVLQQQTLATSAKGIQLMRAKGTQLM
jgi:hypothetical protein